MQHRVFGRSLGLAALTVVLAVTVSSCTSGGSSSPSSHSPAGTTGTGTTGSLPSSPVGAQTSASAPTPTSTAPRKGSGTPVHVSLFEGDGQTYGVAMPIIAYFSVAPTDASVFEKVVTVKVNGKVVHGAWYWEHSSQASQAMEAHYRMQKYWPAHATISVSLPVQGLWAGKGLMFDDSLSLSMKTGAEHVVKVNGKAGVEHMRVFSDGKLVRTLPVSLGKADTPTYEGTAVVMSKSNPQHMVSAPGEPYYSIEVPWSVRMTYDGEFIHDAYWNGELGQQNLSHGCTNLSPADAQWYYGWSLVGDPVSWKFTGTTKTVPVTDGWGDWNASWAGYKAGGLLAPDGPA